VHPRQRRLSAKSSDLLLLSADKPTMTSLLFDVSAISLFVKFCER
jgi:hypothetical protein